ncbi:MAG: hypothetical protein IPP61_09410 [Cytophagaceae bacterium]|nr:hypothetical protein [Cytophagaceae bacterium]MBK9933730.1 hypothetical protein [Cytophagaceae bacterium]MBL0302555.1 hypothetical protein [Cytophagaceae bacterium]MBL0325382.1 hypothetical protein [Cytophagaceae bacterium]
MKKNISFLFIILIASLSSCAPGSMPTSSKPAATVADTGSPEAKAKAVTDKMTQVLGLSTDQTDKVMMINVVNFKIVKRLRETNDTGKLPTTKEKYQNEMKEVLNEQQFTKFLTEFSEI